MLVHLDHTIQIWREGGTYVARAHPLDVMSCGESLQAARRNLEEALQLFIKVAAEQGTLDEILHEAGSRLKFLLLSASPSHSRHNAEDNSIPLDRPRKDLSGRWVPVCAPGGKPPGLLKAGNPQTRHHPHVP